MSDDAKFFSALQARLFAIENRLNKLETSTAAKLGYLRFASYYVNNISVNAGATATTDDVYTLTGMPAKIKGLVFIASGIGASGALAFGPSDGATPDGYCPKLVSNGAGTAFSQLLVPVGSDGKMTIAAIGANWSSIYVNITGWWL